MIKINKIFSTYNKIPEDRYKLIIMLAEKELNIYSYTAITKNPKSFHVKRAHELIEAINYVNNNPFEREYAFRDSLTNYSHRRKINLESKIEQEVFINNYVLPDTNNFIHVLKINNINSNDIRKIDLLIKQKKIEARETKKYDLEIEKIIDIDRICTYYNFNSKEIIINKMIELYQLRKDLMDELDNIKIKK